MLSVKQWGIQYHFFKSLVWLSLGLNSRLPGLNGPIIYIYIYIYTGLLNYTHTKKDFSNTHTHTYIHTHTHTHLHMHNDPEKTTNAFLWLVNYQRLIWGKRSSPTQTHRTHSCKKKKKKREQKKREPTHAEQEPYQSSSPYINQRRHRQTSLNTLWRQC